MESPNKASTEAKPRDISMFKYPNSRHDLYLSGRPSWQGNDWCDVVLILVATTDLSCGVGIFIDRISLSIQNGESKSKSPKKDSVAYLADPTVERTDKWYLVWRKPGPLTNFPIRNIDGYANVHPRWQERKPFRYWNRSGSSRECPAAASRTYNRDARLIFWSARGTTPILAVPAVEISSPYWRSRAT